MIYTKSEHPALLADVWSVRAADAILLVAAAVTPVLFNPWGCNPFERPKAALVQALALLALPLLLLRGLDARTRGSNRKLLRSVPLLAWAALALGLAQTGATAFSVDPRTSVWGSAGRQQGLVTLLSYLVLFALAAGMDSKRRVERLFRALAWSSVPAVAYGFLQSLGVDPLGWHTDAASPVLSTLGRSNFVGSYLVLVAPVTMACAWPARRRWPYLALLAAQGVCLLLTRARSAWVGAAACLLATGALWAILSQRRRWLWWGLVVLVSAISLFLVLGRDSGLLSSPPRTDAGSMAARLTIWKTVLPLLSAHPWLGYGPETLKAVFLRVFPPQLVYYQGRHVVVDRAHNLWLDLGMSAGGPGIAAMLAVLVGFGLMAARTLRVRADRWQCMVWTALIGAVLGHVIDSHFTFDLTAGSTIFWLLLGVAVVLSRLIEEPTPVGGTRPETARVLPWLLPLTIVLALIGWLCGRPALADAACWQAQQLENGVLVRVRAAERATHLWPVEPQYRLVLAEQYGMAGQWMDAQTEISAAIQLASNDAQAWAAGGAIYAWGGQVDPMLYQRAEAAYRQALAMAPNIAAWHTSLGLVLARQGHLAEAIAAIQRAVDLDATDGVAYSHLADLYQAAGRTADAHQAWLQAEHWGWTRED